MRKEKPRGQMGRYNCDACGKEFTARVADRNRGWARFCSKACKAKKPASSVPVTVVAQSRYIEIKACATCLHRDHKGAFGAVSYIPVCRMSQGRVLPHDVSEVKPGFVSASVKPGIPDWCPLPKLKGM